MFATNPSLMVVYCHLVIFAETMEHDRDLEQEEMLGDIIRDGIDDSTSQFLNNSDGEGREDAAPVIEWREKMMAPVVLEP